MKSLLLPLEAHSYFETYCVRPFILVTDICLDNIVIILAQQRTRQSCCFQTNMLQREPRLAHGITMFLVHAHARAK